jgi:hypothetical protein
VRRWCIRPLVTTSCQRLFSCTHRTPERCLRKSQVWGRAPAAFIPMAVLRFSWLASEKPSSVLPQDTRSRPGPYQTIACFCLFSSCADGGSGPSTHAVRGRFFVPIEHRSYAQKIPGSGAEPQANRKLLGPGRTPSHAALRGRPFIMREDPDRMLFVADDRPNLVSLKLRDCEGCYS